MSHTATLAEVLDALRQREPIFHRVPWGTTRDSFARMVSDDFHEVGASGQCYSRDTVLDVLAQRHAGPAQADDWQTSDFHCQPIGPDHYLLCYTLQQGTRISRRSTLWRRHGTDWLIVFHQGTLVATAT